MSSLLLIRHGQASLGAADYDVLSPLGVIQARRLGDHLAGMVRPDLIVTGPRVRQRDTATHMIAAARARGAQFPDPVLRPEFDEYPALEITCVAHCTGSFDDVMCEPGTTLFTIGFGAGCLCLPDCNRRLQDCASPEHVCYPWNNLLRCLPDVSGEEGQANDPCQDSECDPGLMCANADFVGMGCTGDSWACCTSFCEFPGGDCPNADQQCVQYFDPKELLPGDWRLGLGACGLP